MKSLNKKGFFGVKVKAKKAGKHIESDFQKDVSALAKDVTHGRRST